MARERGVDLVEIASSARPPVCKLLDYGKFLYAEKKKKKESEKKHHVQQVKAMRLRPKTGQHDLQTKMNKAREFLIKGDKVVFTVLFRGRENAHKDRGRDLLKRVAVELEDLSKVEAMPRTEGNRMHMTLLPNKVAQKQKTARAQKKTDQAKAKAKAAKAVEKSEPAAEAKAPKAAEKAETSAKAATATTTTEAKGATNAKNEDGQGGEEKV